MGRAAVFLDKDGTLVEDVPYNVDPALVRFTPGAAEGLVRLHAAGFLLIVVSNQSGVARGRFAEAALEAVERRLHELFGEIDVPLAAFYYCPHHPRGSVAKYATACRCRKPEPGMLLQAAQDHHIDLRQSWLIGDILDDIEAGRRAGCRTILLYDRGETEWQLTAERTPEVVALDLDQAARHIARSMMAGASTVLRGRQRQGSLS